MASTEYSQHMRQGVDAGQADYSTDASNSSQSGDLKGLLNAIVDQISEADRRHSETLQQMQDRLTGIGREAQAIKPRVPEQYAAAFQRIEAGMVELASRITEATGDVPASVSYAPHAAASQTSGPYASQQAVFAEPPKALRSAGSGAAVNRVHAGVDTFDVIESSPPSSVSEPWDRDSAEALAGIYESGASSYAAKPFAQPAPVAALMSTDAPLASAIGADHGWLETRFNEISKRIEESLSDLNPDQNFFALGQRVDQLEQHFSTLFEGVATRNDVEGVRLIEAHVSELAGHLENAQTQLQRLDVIEQHLAGIAGQLDDVHRAALATSDTVDGDMHASAGAFDLDRVARTAAEAAANHLTKIQPRDGYATETAEIGSMLRTFIAEARQGEENTTALLDTLQQAMIRLLDRVDAIELSALQGAQAKEQSHPQHFAQPPVHARADASDLVPEHHSIASDAEYRDAEPEPNPALEAAVAAVATARSAPGSIIGHSDIAQTLSAPIGETQQAVPRSPERMRQDFIAEARRAKMRLAEQANTVVESSVARVDVLSASDASKVPPAAALRGSAKSASAAKKQSSIGNAQRIKVLGLSAMLALGGIWLAKESGLFSSLPLIATSSEPVGGSDVTKSAGATDPAGNPAGEASGTLMPSNAATNDDPAAAPGSAVPHGDAGDLKLPEGTRGEITSDDIVVGSATLPMQGVAVDAIEPMTEEGLARARRQQAMANVSGKLGEAAQRQSGTAVTPAALDLNALPGAEPPAETQNHAPVTSSGMSQSSALDLPPATVGPLSLRLAAANGDPSAEFEVGARLAEGKGTDQTFKDAAKWYQRSASKGFAQAQYRIGTLYERGLGLKTDVERAKEWYTRAADQGNVKAMHNLAVLSANQSNSTPDYATAAQWFEKAAEYGLADSQFNLAVLNENGLGVPEDLVQAYKWLSLSAKSGDKEAIRRRDIIKGKLTATQLADGDKQVATWKSKRSDPEINDARKAGESWKKNPENGVNG